VIPPVARACAVALALVAGWPAYVDAADAVGRNSSTAATVTRAAASGLGQGAEENPLTANGFASPSCTTVALFNELSTAAKTNCQISGVAVAPVPLSNYAFDTNVDSGLTASVASDADSVVQDLLLTPLWTALVWLIHVAVVALEWCFAIDLLAPSMFGEVSRALGSAERVFTQPWLGLALTVAGAACAWNGLVRRRGGGGRGGGGGGGGRGVGGGGGGGEGGGGGGGRGG
jgi:hypothetical protein